jgi:DNA-binding beta-propeller fold protein YncE
MNNTVVTLVILNILAGIAWDWLNEKLYWTDRSGKIEVYDVNADQRKKLIDTGSDSEPRGIVLDPHTR